MSLNIVKRGPDAAAGSNLNFCNKSGLAAPTNDVASVADTIAIKTAKANFTNCVSFLLIIAPAIAATSPHIIPIESPTFTSEITSL